jgi:hypothetical protein
MSPAAHRDGASAAIIACLAAAGEVGRAGRTRARTTCATPAGSRTAPAIRQPAGPRARLTDRSRPGSGRVPARWACRRSRCRWTRTRRPRRTNREQCSRKSSALEFVAAPASREATRPPSTPGSAARARSACGEQQRGSERGRIAVTAILARCSYREQRSPKSSALYIREQRSPIVAAAANREITRPPSTPNNAARAGSTCGERRRDSGRGGFVVTHHAAAMYLSRAVLTKEQRSLHSRAAISHRRRSGEPRDHSTAFDSK